MNNIDIRANKIQEKVNTCGEAFLITSQNNRFYASGFYSSAGNVIYCANKIFIILDFRYFEAAKRMKDEGKLPVCAEIIKIEKRKYEHIKDIFNKYSVKTVLYENYTLSCYEFNELRENLDKSIDWIAAEKLLEECRSSKDAGELDKIRKAQSITDSAFSHILPYIKLGVSERDIVCEIEYFMKKNGADKTAFDTICVSGKKSALPHGTADDTKIQKGFLTIDFGAVYSGYCSDMTRTICIGKPTCEMKRVYQTVLDAQKAAFEVISAGVYGKSVDKAARDLIYKAGYEGCFGHGTGHSLGLDIHESPVFSPSETQKIPENSVLSVEPGIYIEGEFGVRIEDIVIVLKNGYENLTKSGKNFIII